MLAPTDTSPAPQPLYPMELEKMVNNYDTSSMGINIELSVCRDMGIAQREYENCFHVYSHSGTRSTFRAFYTGYGAYPAPESVADCLDLTTVSEEQAREFVLKHLVDGEEWSPSVREVIETKKRDYDNWREFLKDSLVDLNLLGAIRDDFADLSRYFTIKYSITAVTGYKQRDYGEILYDLTPWNGDDFAARKHFERLLFDAPISASVTVDGETFWIDQDLQDPYEWDRKEVAEIVKGYDIDDKAKDWIIAKLPVYPDC